jgi:sigma-B regulation protein RsbU (phosphoserine phosphatase)
MAPRLARDRSELLLAKELQCEMLPVTHPPEAGVDLGARSVPAGIVGGDFYDFFRYSRQGISAEAIGDVSGKGAAAAIYAALVTGILRSLAPLELGPAETLRTLNKMLLERPTRRFVSLIYATWDERQRVFRIANAGLPKPICLRNGEASPVDVSGLPLGMFENAEYEERTVVCDAGDAVVFYTDGVSEAVDMDDEEFGAERVERVICANAGESADRVVSEIFYAVAAHGRGVGALDDQTVVAVRA